MKKATTRLVDAFDALDHLVEWLERFPEAGESSEFHRRLDGLEARITRLTEDQQPTTKTVRQQEKVA
jgi:hypothetical protein